MQHRVAQIRRASQLKMSGYWFGKSKYFDTLGDTVKSLIVIANLEICLRGCVR